MKWGILQTEWEHYKNTHQLAIIITVITVIVLFAAIQTATMTAALPDYLLVLRQT